jgi:hypothetical protein
MDTADPRQENPAIRDDDRLPPAGTATPDAPPSESARVSDRTNVHDAGSQANDTPDGLTESEEAVRHAAEDIPTGADPAGPVDSVPVFDRAGLPPKL